MLKVLVRGMFLSVGLLILLLFLAWFCMRQFASHQAVVKDSIASGSGKCLLNTYFRNYADLGVAGRVASVFGSTHFYRVYSESGDLLATSEWNIGEHEVDVFATEWLGQTAMYPTQHGWASFSLKECAAESAQTLHD
ncbi:hypothetical protein [Stenotrophomonas maltophilia]|uniref:hypothetical protein n=2 Tax=Stenotrophomonas maltophilia TaxID=40324 RepID=UPI000D4187ED|nr:hypothetical protein [Stenotrophomonas maltophilia]PSD12970.1 hypothetical protein C7E19_15570 [Stenotrophomonas maltophilia]